MAVKTAEAVSAPRVEQEKTLVTWIAKSRPYKKSDAQSRQVLIVLGGLVAMVLIFAGEWMLLLVMAAAAFYYYATNRVPPDEAEYRITNKGIKAFNRVYLWWEFSRWWWAEKWGTKLIGLELRTGLTGNLFLPIDQAKEAEIEKVMNENVLFDKPPDTAMDRVGKWAIEKFPLEKKI